MENSIFRTPYRISEERPKIDYASKILLFGSCFSENIGNEFEYLKFDTTINPYGILFNPIAIENAILECLEGKIYTETNLIQHNDLWHSFNHHSDFSDVEKKLVSQQINETIQNTHSKLKVASHIIITLGTAWVYNYNETQMTVANCHKIPQKKFTKKLLSITEIEKSISSIKKSILEVNPKATLIFTVSPVRHLRDGMTENTLSKSHLLTAIHKVTDSSSKYFPAYEIMMDDLRDYRFYEDDMLHPNKLAVKYIWDIFHKTWIAPKTSNLSKKIIQIQKGLSHKPFNPESISHKKFQRDLTKKIEELHTEIKRTIF